jgi:hypothetical protein
MNNQLRTKNLWRGQVFAAGESAEITVDLNTQLPNGYFSLEVAVSGDGTVAVEAKVSNAGSKFVSFTAVPLFSDFGASDGPDSDGCDLRSIEPPAARYLKLIVTATGAVTLDGTLCCH